MFDGPEPLYVQIARSVRDQVLSGALKEEEQVMSTTQYASAYRINPATAAKAFAQLVDEGVLYKRRGIGMFVAPGARAQLAAKDRQAYFADVLDPAIHSARVLGISAQALVQHIEETYRD